MARPIWKGFITFGLVNIPVILFPAEKRSEIQFKLLDSRDKSRIRYVRVNDQTGKEVQWNEIAKGYEYENDNFVLLKDEDIKHIAGENSKTITIESFISKDSLADMDYDKPYYLVPDKKGEKGYVILRETLKATKKVGIAKVIIHTREYLAAVMPYENALVVNLLRYHNELRQPSDFELPTDNLKTYKITPKELEISKQLVASMTTKWNPEDYKDEFKIALEKWIDEKVRHEKPGTMKRRSAASTKTGNVVNFVDLLKKSLKSTKDQKNNKPTKRKAANDKTLRKHRKSSRAK